MTAIDWVIVASCLALALWGYRQGLLVGALSLAGFAAGAALGARFGPELLAEGSRSPYAPATALLGGLLLGAIAAVAMEGIARNVRGRWVRGGVGTSLDGIGGALLLVALGLGLVWVLGAVALHTPGAGELRVAVQRSVILGELNALLPPSGPILRILNRIDPTPRVQGPEARVPPPDVGIARDADVDRAGAGVVRVLGTACGLGVSGSGWVAAPGLVVTNAHVVAGQDDTTITTRTGTEVDATAVGFEPRNDLAVLRFEGIEVPALGLARRARSGAPAAVLGYPENGPFTVTPARVGRTARVVSDDAYGRGPVTRRMTSFRGDVRDGNSGGPVVNSKGRVAATVFAAAIEARPRSGLGIPNSIVARALDRAQGPVDTGACVA